MSKVHVLFVTDDVESLESSNHVKSWSGLESFFEKNPNCVLSVKFVDKNLGELI